MSAGVPLLSDGPASGDVLLLAHGAGAPMDSGFMTTMADLLAGLGIRVVRFEFAYMAARRSGEGRKPPSRMPHLLDEFRQAIIALKCPRLFIGGKSMGGRAATMLAVAPGMPQEVAGLVCLGYPFHPPGKPEKLRTSHLADIRLPALIVQGERDPFGTRAEVPGLNLPAGLAFHWCPAGNHDLVPPKRSGHTAQENWRDAAGAIASFMARHR